MTDPPPTSLHYFFFYPSLVSASSDMHLVHDFGILILAVLLPKQLSVCKCSSNIPNNVPVSLGNGKADAATEHRETDIGYGLLEEMKSMESSFNVFMCFPVT